LLASTLELLDELKPLLKELLLRSVLNVDQRFHDFKDLSLDQRRGHRGQ
jgi:hypothetical protein